MSQNGPRRIQFINLTSPINATSVESQRRADSHAAREAHARTRRLRTLEHRARNNGEKNNERVSEQGIHSNAATPSTHIVVKSENVIIPSLLTLISSDRRDPFTSFPVPFRIGPLSIFCSIIILDVKAVVPYVNEHCNRLRDSVNYLEKMTKEWVRLALSDLGFLHGVFLFACRHLVNNHHQQEFYDQLAIQYKIACVRAVNAAISVERVSFSHRTVAKVLVLAWDEIWLGDFNMSWSHLKRATKMVELNGGLQTLGLNGFLEHLYHQLPSYVGMPIPRF